MKNEREIAEMIFQLFRNVNCRENQGYMWNSLNDQLISKLTPKEQEIFNVVYCGLQALQYISVDQDSNFIRLAQKGYNYIYDDELVAEMQKLPWVIPNYKENDWINTNWGKAYNKLWKFIGPKGASFHLKGSDFYKYVYKLCEDLPPTYTIYVTKINEDASKHGKSVISRSVYYENLINHLEEEKRYKLYVDIQTYIESSIFNNAQKEEIPLLLDDMEGKKDVEIEQELKQIKESSTDEKRTEETRPIVFISYSWDDAAHEKWVENLANKLCEEGVIDVVLDKWEMKFGKLLPKFMENAISKAERVICVMTPNYKKKTEKLQGGVGYEYSIMSAEIFNNIHSDKFIPLFRSGEDVPNFLSGRNYVDMREDNKFGEKFEDLLRDIWDEPKHKKPEIGPKPNFD